MFKINSNPPRRVSRPVVAVLGGATILVGGFSALSAEAQASPAPSHTLKGSAVCAHFATGNNDCHGGTLARGGKIFHYQWKSGFGYNHWTMLHASHSTCTSITLTWTSARKASSNHSSLTVVTDAGSKKGSARGGKIGTISSKITGTHALIVKGFDSDGADIYVAGQMTCRTSSGH